MKKILSILLPFIMIISITAGLGLSVYADNAAIIGNYASSFLKGELNDLSNSANNLVSKASDYISSVSFEPTTLALTANANDDYKYSVLDDSTVVINSYSGNAASLEIPSQIDGYKVTAIGAYAFAHKSFTKVVVPNSVTNIGKSAFEGCSSLVEMSLPFTGSSVGATKDYYDTHFGYIFGYTYSELTAWNSSPYHYFNGHSTVYNYKIPSTLKKVTITGNKILPQAFIATNITMPIEEIVISQTVTSIGKSAFSGCNNLTKVDYLGTVEQWAQIDFEAGSANPASVCKSLYFNGNLLTDLKLQGEMKDYAFYNCKSLKSVEFGDKVTNVSANAFENCTNIETLKFGDTVKIISYKAFANCTSLTKVVVPNSATEIGVSAFEGCLGAIEIIIPNSVKSIGKGAFSGCSSVEKIVLPFVGLKQNDSWSLFGEIFGDTSYEGGILTKQYYSGSSSGSYYIPASLKSVTINQGELKYGAFYNCSKISEITIGKDVHSFGENAFYGCNNLSKVNYLGTVDEWVQMSFESSSANPLNYARKLYINGSLVSSAELKTASKICCYSFYNCESLENVTMSNSVKTIESNAFIDCENLKNIVIGKGVTKIESNAFSGCEKIVHIYYKGTKEEWEKIKCSDNTINNAIVHCNAMDSDISHVWNNGVVAKEPTCTEKGEMKYTCLNCADVFKMEIKENGHTYDDGEVITQPTNYKTGEMRYKCEVCDDILIEPIDKLPPSTNGVTDLPVNGSEKFGYYVPKSVNVGSVSGSVHCGSVRLMKPGDTLTCHASGSGVCNTITWSYSTNDSIRIISGGTSGSSQAVIKAVSPGIGWVNGIYWSDVYVSGYCNNATAVQVVNPLNNIYCFNSEVSMQKGEIIELGLESGNVCYEPYSRYAYCVSGVSFSSSDETVATVNSDGTVTAVGYGTSEITIQTTTGINAVENITVMCDNHDFAHSVKKVATCTANGILEKTCKVCGYKITSTIPKTGHTEVTDRAVAPTCTKSGLTEGSHCSVCGDVIISQEMINAKGHKYASIVTVPTCTEMGYTEHTCHICGYSYTDNYVNATGHNFGANNTNCSVCGAANPNYVAPQPAQPTTPTKPAQPTQPTTPTQPSAPAQSTTPTKPAATAPTTTEKAPGGAIKVSGEWIAKKQKNTKIKKLTGAKKSIKVSWSKVSGITGYQIQYSTSSKFTKKTTKSVTIKKNKTTSTTVKKLKAKKKYYVRVRTYKNVKLNGKTVKVYSSWSKAKTVKTK